ncbi:MAG: DUF4290 domain-containing protein [Tannerella sp.]|jgi:hypothetical protein|nr:DUF4290 domain-containing protein [Tannerella sp.]
MEYNTTAKRLTLPEYGRNLQNMVDFCVTIENRDERNRCADTIINIMGNMFPQLRDVNDFKHILWDHLAIMSDFRLDVDYPYEIIKKDNLYKRPPTVPYSESEIIYRHYGQILEKLIHKASYMEDGDEKEALIHLIATQMKRSFLTWNKDSVDNRKILKDLAELSEGKIIRYEDSFKISDNFDLTDAIPRNNPPSNKKKKKKSK